MKLIYKPQKRVIVTFPQGLEGAAQFSEDQQLLEENMKDLGITIPLENLSEYPELMTRKRKAIYLDDKSFGKAFYEIYFRDTMNPDKFEWIK